MKSLYALVNLVFMVPAAFIYARATSSEQRRYAVTLLILLVLTLIFDNAIIAAGIVDYDPARISGLKLGLAPIEDFDYAVVAAIVIPWIWTRLGVVRSEKTK